MYSYVQTYLLHNFLITNFEGCFPKLFVLCSVFMKKTEIQQIFQSHKYWLLYYIITLLLLLSTETDISLKHPVWVGNQTVHVCSAGVCVYGSQLFSGGGQVFGELGEAEVGAVDHICLTATLSRTHRLTVTLIAQTPVFST